MATAEAKPEQDYLAIEKHADIPSLDFQSDSEENQSDDDLHSFSGVAESDRKFLQEEEEREKLLSSGNASGSQKGSLGLASRKGKGIGLGVRESKQRPEKARKKRRRQKMRHEDEELLYEMEKGRLKDNISSHSSSSSLELDRLGFEQTRLVRVRKQLRYVAISGSIAILFAILAFGAYFSTSISRKSLDVSLLSNGSSSFAPTTILISLDGFRADFLNRGLTPTLNSFIAEGVSPKHMLPSFPSVTFPNHYTLVTGLYPESHGVVGNTFWDPDLQEEFYYTDPTRSMQPKWWLGGEPLWVTAEKQDVKTAIHMWPGSEAHITLEPTFLDKFNADEPLPRKVDRILELLDMSDDRRPQFIAAYVPVVDADGHLYGPNSTEIRGTINDVDNMLNNIFTGLDDRNLTNIANIVVVSDHGMASTSTDRLIQLDDLIDLDLVEHIDGWPLYGLRPKDPKDIQGLYDTLQAEAVQNPHFDVYLRDKDMPERFHFSKNDRIAPLWVIPKTGWAIVHKADFDVLKAKADGQTYHPKGLHGYDHEHPLMRAIFVARGPAFPHKPNSRLDNFQNTEVYNIVCDSLFIEPKPNNGTLRLPLKPIGLHSDFPDSAENLSDHPPEVEFKPEPEHTTSASDTTSHPTSLTPSSVPSLISSLISSSTPSSTPSSTASSTPSLTPTSTPSLHHNSTAPNPQKEDANDNFWRYFVAKLKAVKAWVEKSFKSTDREEGDGDGGGGA